MKENKIKIKESTENLEVIRERLKLSRKKAAISQNELAQKLGVNPNTIGRWESGQNSPSRYFRELASVLHTNVAYLMGDSMDDSPDFTLGGNSFFGQGIRFCAVPITSSLVTPKIEFDKNSFYPRKVYWQTDGNYPVREAEISDYQPQLRRRNLFAFEVEGDSMAPEIADRSFVIFTSSNPVLNGETAIVFVEGRMIVRRIFFNKDTVRLKPLNNEYSAIERKISSQSEFCILGRVVLIINRPYKPKSIW